MKKASIKKLFQRHDKSPKTPTEEAWGELCTTQTPPKASTPQLTPVTPRRSNLPRGESSPESSRSNGSQASHEYTLDRHTSHSSMERMSSLSRFSSARNSVSSRRSSRNGTAGGVPRFPLEHYSSASAVDLDAPIEAYDGPIDLDESIHSASSGTWGSHGDDSHLGGVAAQEDAEGEARRTSSPDTIPVVYEDGYDSDSWSGNCNRGRQLSRFAGLLDDVSCTTDSFAPSLGDYPLAKRYTNDETMHVPREDEDDVSAVYSLKARSGEESVIAPMSADELDGMGEGLGFVRHETDDSALDDEDYYKQDYFNMMTASKRLIYEERGSDEEEEERELVPSLSERVLMSDEDGYKTVKRYSSQELTSMTQPDLPLSNKPEEEEEGGDYGDFYTDVSFPVIHDDDGGNNSHGERRLDDGIAGEIEMEPQECNQNGHDESDGLANPQDRLEQVTVVLPALMLPADNEFVDDNNDAGIASNESCGDPIQVDAYLEATECDEEGEHDIGIVVVEPVNIAEAEEELLVEAWAKANEGVMEELLENNCDGISTNEPAEVTSEADRGNSAKEEEEELLDDDHCGERGIIGITHLVMEERDPAQVEKDHTETALVKIDNLLQQDSTSHFDEQIAVDELNCQEITILNANTQEEQTEDIQVLLVQNDVSLDNADVPCPMSPLVRSNSFANSPSHCDSSQAASPRRYSLGSITMEGQETTNLTRPPKTPHKEITDNLVVAGVMSLFMGGGRFAGKFKAMTPMKGYSTNTEHNQVYDAKLASKGESPGLCSIPSLASPLVTPLAKTVPASATFDFEGDNILTSPTATKSVESQLHNDIGDTSETMMKESAPDVVVFMQDDTQLLNSRSRSLSPTPKTRQTFNVDKPYAFERSMSLPVKWNPFPVSSLQISSFELSNLIAIGSNDGAIVEMEENSNTIISQPKTCSDVENGIDFPRLPLIGMSDQCTPNAPPSPTNSKASAESFAPGTTIDVQKIIRENQRLRIKRQQLCESLGSMAQQFAAYENASAEKIFSLEQKNRALLAEKEHSVFVDKSGMYDAETVHKLSTGVLTQEKMLEAKDRQISQLTLKLEVLRRTLHDKDEKHKQSKTLWEEERMKFHSHLASPEKKSFLALKQELLESKMEVTRLKEALDNALSDIDALTTALESNNEALDRAIVELEDLKKWKSDHNPGENFHVPTISRVIVPPLSTSPLKAHEHDLRKQKATEMADLQKDLEHSLHELNELRELVATHNRKNYRELEVEIQLLHNEAEASSLEKKLANQRIKQLSADVEAKTEEMMKLRQELLVMESARHQKDAPPTKDDLPAEELPSSSSNSDRRSKDIIKDFLVVSDLVKKISEMKHKLAEYEKSDGGKTEGFKESKNEDTDVEVQSLRMSESNEATGVSESSSSKRAQPESPLTARRLFQPLRRGWAANSPLIRNPISDSPESRESSMKEKDMEIARLNDTIKANTEVMEKLKRDIMKIQSEKEEIEFDFTSKIDKLNEENLAFASQVAALEKAFMEMNDQRVSDGDEATDDGSSELPLSPSSLSEYIDTAQEEDVDLQPKHISLQRSIVELERTQSHQEDEIEHLKAELVKLRVTSQQEKDAALEQLREELAIVTAQRSALESQLFEINKSAGLLRNSLSDQASSSPNKKRHESTPGEPTSPSCGLDGVAGGDPILVAQVVMLENANRVLERSVNSLRSDMQQKLAPLLEKIAMLEEEKRIMEDEMNAKLECREITITNLENSLQQLTSTRSKASTKRKKHRQINSPV